MSREIRVLLTEIHPSILLRMSIKSHAERSTEITPKSHIDGLLSEAPCLQQAENSDAIGIATLPPFSAIIQV